MAKIGDTVRFLNSVGGGKIVKIEGNIAQVEDSDGFIVPVLVKECVVVMAAGDAKAKASVAEPQPVAPQSKEVKTEPALAPIAQPEPLPVVETPEGNSLNIVLAFEPLDIKSLSTTTFEATLVNDSNYYISFVFATKSADESEWTLRKASTVEPNIMLSLGEYTREEVGTMDRILFQYAAYKIDKPYASKPVASVENKVDTTKFYKLHCFKENIYFDQPVISFELVTDDKPYTPTKVSANEIERAMRQKKSIDRPVARPIRKKPVKRDNVIEVDLHINELVDNTNGLSRADMLNMQIDEFRRIMDANMKNHGQKIVFIHGKGEGILRQALLKELNHKYKGHDVCDASFREYGYGATQVTIR